MQVVLVMFSADGQRRSFSLPRTITVIGRREDCDLRIPLGEVSRKHCRFIIDQQMLRLEDLGSSNGTYHNGQRIQEAVIAPGDLVQVGPVVCTVQVDGEPADEDIQPVVQAGDSNDTNVTAKSTDPDDSGAPMSASPDDGGEVVDLNLDTLDEAEPDNKKKSKE